MDIQRAQLKKNIVILGAGFAGIACALKLERMFRKKSALFKNFAIVLVDKKNYHLYTPALYDVATTAADDGSPLDIKKAVATPMEEITENARITFIQGRVLKVNIAERKIIFDDETVLPYAYIVFALGSETTYFNIPGMKEYAIPLKRLDDAIHIRAAIRRKYEEKSSDGEIAVVVCGGGPTGIEFASECAGYIKKLNAKYKKSVRLALTIVEGAPTILPGFDEWTVQKTGKRLGKLGIRLYADHLISRADEKAAYMRSPAVPNEERLPYDALIWSGGVQAVNVLTSDNISLEKRGRMETDHFMTCISPDAHMDIGKNMFAIGDNACFYDPDTHRPPPTTARLAIEQGKIAAKNIFYDILGKPRVPFRLRRYPFVIPLGGKCAIAQIGPLRINGFFGWAFHEIIELYYLWSVTNNNWTAIKRWWRGLEIFSKND